jgi:RNA polymerase sigma-70 factor (ECF subfamily)
LTAAALEAAVRTAGTRIRAALAARFRSLDLAEESFAEACARAAKAWPADGVPANPAGWLYRTAERAALDQLRRSEVRQRLSPPAPESLRAMEEVMDAGLIPDERLRLIFVCCHPAIAAEARAALTLKVVCGLSTGEIATAFLLPEPTLAQRLVRAKRKIAEAGIPFEVPGPRLWRERLDAVLDTIEIAYAKAHEDSAGTGPHRGYAIEMLNLSGTLAELVPDDPDVLALAATIRFAEARRPARLGPDGLMIPLVEQDPARWDQKLITAGREMLARASPSGSWRAVQAAIHAAWCSRQSLAEPAPWRRVLAMYDRLLAFRDDAVVRINRAVALAEVESADAGLSELNTLQHSGLATFKPYLATRADLLRRAGRREEAQTAYAGLLALDLPQAERRWLERRASLVPSPRA